MIGNYKSTIDEKGRSIIPNKFRNEIGTKLIVSFEFEKALVIRKKESFEKWSSFLLSKGTLNKNARILQRMILGNSIEITIDSKGRILIPKQLIEKTNIKQNIQFIGLGDKLEVFSEEDWEKMNSNVNEKLSIEDAAEILGEM